MISGAMLIVLSVSLTGEPRVKVTQYPDRAACVKASRKVINRLGKQLWKGCVSK